MEEQEVEEKELVFKILILGTSSVGKTSIIHRYVENNFTKEYKATIGVDFSAKSVEWAPGLSVRLQIWDMAGQERFGGIMNAHFRNTDGVMCVLDSSKPETIEDCKIWFDKATNKCTGVDGELNNPPIVCLGNKYDLYNSSLEHNYKSVDSISKRTDPLLTGDKEDMVEIDLDPAIIQYRSDTEHFQAWAKESNYADGFLVSAKTGQGIEDAFKSLIEKMVERYVKDEALGKLNRDIERAKLGIFKIGSKAHEGSYSDRIYSMFTNC